jgi:membrane-associated two-gene conflict system component 1 (EACC1)
VPTELLLTLSFDGADAAEANRFAAELAERLRDADAPINVQEMRADPNAQDFGATLALLLAAPTVVALAKGISAWLAMRPDAKVTIKGKDGTLIASGLTSADARAVIEQRLGKGD